MKVQRYVVGAIVMSSALIAAGCSTTPSAQNTTTTSNPAQVGTTGSSTVPSSAEAVNVPVSNEVRAQLVATGAAFNNVPVSQYTGLAPGLTYYALDKTTGTYWAGARLVPAPSSDPSSPTQAQISSQDAGSYNLFTRPQGGSWTAYRAGNTGQNSPCPISVPPAVLQVWGWSVGSCRPSGV